MLLEVITLLLAVATQTDALFTVAMPPPDVPTFEVVIEGQSPFFAGIKINGSWVTDSSTEIKPTQNVEFVMDSPFYTTAPFTVPMRRAQIKYEPPAMRRARLEGIWTANGYTFLDTASGWKTVRKVDIELAERARKMAAVTKETAIPFSTDNPTEKPVPTGTLSARTLLLFRATIIIVGCVLAGLGLKYIFRKEATWKAME